MLLVLLSCVAGEPSRPCMAGQVWGHYCELWLLMPLTIPSGPGLQASSSIFKRFLPWPFSAFCLPCLWRAAYPRVLGLLRICHLRR